MRDPFGPSGEASYRQWTRDLGQAMGGFDLSDEAAERDRGDWEGRLERASGNRIADEYLLARGLDPLDAFAIAKGFGGDAVGRGVLQQHGRRAPLTPEDAFHAEFKGWSRGFESRVVEPYFQETWTGAEALATGRLEASAMRAADPRSLERRLSALSSGGLMFDRHLDTVAGLIAHAQGGRLDVGQFSLEQPTALSYLVERARSGDAGRTHLAINAPFSRGQQLGSALMSHLGYDVQQAPDFGGGHKVTDHFKLWGARLDDADVTQRMLLVGSVNLTQAAVGRGVDRFGQRWGDRGANVESNFLLSHGLVTSGKMGAGTFESLTQQAAAAFDWVHHDRAALDKRADFLDGSMVQSESRVLTGAGIATETSRLFGRLGAGDSAAITTYNIGSDILEGDILGALERGATVHLYHGARYDVASNFAGEMQVATPADGSLRAFKAFLQGQADAGVYTQGQVDGVLSRLVVRQNTQQLVHAKVTDFNIGGTLTSIIGSMNYDNEQRAGEYLPHPGKDYHGAIRNVGVLIAGGDVQGLLGEMQGLHMRMARVGAMYAARPSGYREMGDTLAQWQASAATYGLGAGAVRETRMGVKLTVGGVFHIGQGPSGASIDLGRLFSLDIGESTRGYAGQLYLKDFSKFVNPVFGIAESADAEGLDKTAAPRTFAAREVLLAAIAASQAHVQQELDAYGRAFGAVGAVQRLRDPFERGRLRFRSREFTKDRMRNFAGWEQGNPAYDAKAFARLAFRMTGDGRKLDLTDDFLLDASRMDRALQGQPAGHQGEHVKLAGLELMFASGGLSRFNKSGNASAARLFDLQLMETLPATARFKREDGRHDYIFLLSAAKFEQMPQRLQTLMSARDLTPLDEIYGSANNQLFGESMLVAGNGQAGRRGVIFRGYGVAGLTGDNAYLNADVFRGVYFGDESWHKNLKLPDRNIVQDSLTLLEDTVRGLVRDGLAHDLGGDRIRITAAGLESLGHRLPVADFYVGDTQATMRGYLPLKSAEQPHSELVIDLAPGKLTLDRGAGVVTLGVSGIFARELTGGDRTVLKMKAPTVFAKGSSRIFTTLDAVGRHAGAGYDALGMDRANAVFGLGNLKTGEAFLETGLKLLAEGASTVQFDAMANRADLVGTRGGGTVDYTVLFNKLRDYMSEDALRGLGVHRDVNGRILLETHELRGVLANAQGQLAGGRRKVSLQNDPHLVAAALLAFGVHAESTLSRVLADDTTRTELGSLFGGAAPIEGVSASGLAGLSGAQILAALPLYFVAGFSASAVAMSSRNRINFLNYHSGKYTDAFMDVMALDPKVKQRGEAYQELLGGGLLGVGGYDEVVAGHLEDSVFGYYVPGNKKEFTQLLRITRELQGLRRRKGGLTSERIDELERQANVQIDAIHANLAKGGVLLDVEGGYESSQIQEILGIQLKANVGARTLLVPQVGYTQHGEFVTDINNPRETRLLQVRLLSAKALKALGSFEDYSHEIQRLQVEIERKMGLLKDLTTPDGQLRTNLSFPQRQAYTHLLGLAGELAEAQRMAGATELQKVLGGQLAMPGRNVVAGALPDIAEGTAIVGTELWAHLKAEAHGNIVAGLRQASGAALKSLTAGERGVYGGDMLQIQAQELLHALNRQVHGLGPLAADLQALQAKLISPNATSKGTPWEIDHLVDSLLENQTYRSALMTGVFQRAGAPMGPHGIVNVRHLMTVEEYNATRGRRADGLELDPHMNRRSLFMALGEMGYNLGDYDGDTASIGTLGQYSKLRVQRLLGGLGLSETEQVRLAELENRLRSTAAETTIEFARDYSGWHDDFGDSMMYLGRQDGSSREIQQAKRRLQGLREARGAGKALAPANAAFLEATEARLSMLAAKGVAINRYVDAQTDLTNDIKAFVSEALASGRASSERAALTDFYTSTRAGVVARKAFEKSLGSLINPAMGDPDAADPSGRALTANQLATFFVMTSYTSTIVMGKIFEAAHTSQAFIGMERASTTLALSTRTRQLMGGRYAGDLAPRDLVNKLRQDLDRFDHSPKQNAKFFGGRVSEGDARGIVQEYDTAMGVHADLSGIILVAQQIAREAIKPAGQTEMLAQVRERHPENAAEAYESGVRLSLSQTRTKGLNALYQIIQGSDFEDNGVDTGHWQTQDPTRFADARDEHGKLKADGRWGFEYAFEAIHDMFVDYYQTQVGSLVKNNTLSPELLVERLTRKDQNGETLLYADEAEVRAAMGLAPDEQLRFNEGVLTAHLVEQARRRTITVLDKALEVAGHRERRNAYMAAVDGDHEAQWQLTAGQLDAHEKLMVLGATSARGKFASERALERALVDIFDEFAPADASAAARTEAARELHTAASAANDSPVFADHMHDLYLRYTDTGDMHQALRRVARHAAHRQGASSRLMNAEIETETAHIEDPVARAAARARLEKDKGAEFQTARAAQGALSGIFTRLQALHGHTDAAAAGEASAVESAQTHFHNTLLELGEGQHQGLAGAVANVFLPAFLSHAVAGGAAGAGGYAAASGYDQAADTVAQFGAMAVAMASPLGMARGALDHQHDREALTRAAIATSSLGIGAGAGHYAGRWAAESAELAGHAHAAGGAALLASATAGLVAGASAGTLLEAVAIRTGLVRGRNPVAAMVAQLLDPIDEFHVSDAAEQEAEEALAGGTTVNESVMLVDAAGEPINQTFWIHHHATDDADALDASAAGIEGDVGTYVSAGSYDQVGENATQQGSVYSAAYQRQLDGQT